MFFDMKNDVLWVNPYISNQQQQKQQQKQKEQNNSKTNKFIL